jgi:hypothetical protein
MWPVFTAHRQRSKPTGEGAFMFSGKDDAVRQLSDAFEADQIAVIVALLRPCICFEAAPERARVGGTRIGGTPDLPPDIAWPIRGVPNNAKEIANFGGFNHATHIRKHIALPLPYSFIAQMDLTEAAQASGIDGSLPDHGRLLFFCDLPVIPWRDGVESCKVIWDISDPATLAKTDTPPVLQRLADESLVELRAEFEKHGLNTDALSHAYWGVERSLRITPAFALPDAGAPEAHADAAFVTLMTDEDIADAYSDFISERAHDRAEGAARHRVLGYPLPEQDDPRFTAVALVDYGQAHFWEWEDRTDPAVIDAKMRAWHLLFQCDLSDYHQDRLSEGTVYFLTREDHLHARDFDQVVAVYQQT